MQKARPGAKVWPQLLTKERVDLYGKLPNSTQRKRLKEVELKLSRSHQHWQQRHLKGWNSKEGINNVRSSCWLHHGVTWLQQSLLRFA